MPETTLSAIVDHFLKEDDVVHKKALTEVYEYDEAEVYFILACLTSTYESGMNELPTDFFETSTRIQEMRKVFGREELERVLGKLQDTVLEIFAESNVIRVRTEEFPAIRALYFDVQVRYGAGAEYAFLQLYDFLTIKWKVANEDN